MAVALGSTARVTFGTLYTSPVSNITVAVTIKVTTAATLRMATKWGSDATFEQSFLIVADTGTLVWGIRGHAGGALNVQKTTSTPVVNGALLRMVGRFTASTTPEIWLNGAQEATTTTPSSTGTPTNVAGSTAVVAVGYEPDEAINGVAGDYSELAIWHEAVPDWVAIGYGKGMSPRYYRSNGALYCPMVHTGYLVNEWDATGGTNSSGTSAVHPAMYYPG